MEQFVIAHQYQSIGYVRVWNANKVVKIYFENPSSNHLSDFTTRSLERYRMSRNVDCRSPRDPTIGGFEQFIIFRLSSHLAREIEWRFSFGDISRPGNNSAAVSLPLFLFYRSTGIVPCRIIVLAAAARSRSSFPRFCHSHPCQRAAFFSRRVTQSVCCTLPSWICNYRTYNIRRGWRKSREYGRARIN